jgi:putative DNA primase/helicase
MFSDESKQVGNIEGLKKLTGGLPIKFEEKGRKGTNYRYTGMVVICSNDSIFVGDSISAIARRHIQLFFTAIVPKEKRKNLNEIFKAELPAFTKYLLNLQNDWIKETLDNSQGCGGITAQSWSDTCRTNSIAAWADEHIIWDVTWAEKIGNTKAEGNEKFDDCTSLYQSYSLFCQRAGYFAVNCRNFSELLNEVAITLGKEITKIHTRTGNQLHGIKLRKTIRDAEIPTYTEILEKAENPDPTPSPDPVTPVPVTDGDGYGDGCVTDSVTDETLTVYGCDGCDGLKPNFSNDFSGLSDSEIKEIASDLLLAVTQDDIDTFQTLVSTYQLVGMSDHKKRVWAAMTQNDQAIIKNFIDKHK